MAARPAANGIAHLTFARREETTFLARVFQKGALRVFRPRAEADDCMGAVLLNTSGGIVGGDMLEVSVDVAAGSVASVTSQAAEKAYRSAGPDAGVDVHLNLKDGACLEWLPQETILFDGARLRRRLRADLEADARLLAADMLVFGRIARGERFQSGLLHDRFEIRIGGRLAWADALRLAPHPGRLIEAPFGAGGAGALATCVYVGQDAKERLALARALVDRPGVRSGATCIASVLIVRFMAEDPAAARQALQRFCARFRHEVAGLPERMPAIWRS
jgi:urease accessory protein